MCSVRRVRHAAAKGCVSRPAATDLCLATSQSSVMSRHWYTFPLLPTPPSSLCLQLEHLPEALLITSTLLCNHPHCPDCPSKANIRQILQEVASSHEGWPWVSSVPILSFNLVQIKIRFCIYDTFFWLIFTNPPIIKTSPVCPTSILLSAFTCQISWKDPIKIGVLGVNKVV